MNCPYRVARERVLTIPLGLLLGMLIVACAEQPSTTSPFPTITARNLVLTATQAPSATPGFAVVTPTRSATPTLTSEPVHTFTPTRILVPSPTLTSVPPSATPACTETQGRIQVGTFSSGIVGQEQPYRIYLPPCYDFDNNRYPVLYLLHGYSYDDSHWDDLGIDEAANAGIADGTLPAFIIAMPAADNEGTYTKTSGGAGSFEAVLLEEFIPFIESSYRSFGRAEGRAIGGMSRGGVWALEIAFRNPDRFAAVGGHSAALNVNLAPPIYDPLHLAADPSIRSLRIYLDAGESDWVLPGMEELHAALTAAGVPHEYNLFEGYHDDSYWLAHVEDYLAFYAAGW